MDKFGEFFRSESFGCFDLRRGASAALFGAVRGLLAAVFGAMSSYFTVKALISFFELGYLFLRVVLSEANSVDIHVVSSLRGGLPSVIVGVSFDSKGFVESSTIIVFEGDLFLPFAMLFDCFLGPVFKVPRILGGGVVDIGVNDGIEEAFL